MASLALLLSWTLVIFIPTVLCHQCLVTSSEDGPPSFPGSYSGSGQELIQHQQAVFTSYVLECCGNITTWGVDVHPGYPASSEGGNYTIDFQVWRPSPTVNKSEGTGCYSLVGNNRFSAITDIFPPGVVIVTPSPQDYIQFQPGDVLGVYVEEASVSTSGQGVVMLTRNDFTSEVVWYANIAPAMATSINGGCPYSVGSKGVLNSSVNAAAVISISAADYPCPSVTNGDIHGNTQFSTAFSISTSIGAALLISNILIISISTCVCLKRKKNNVNDLRSCHVGTETDEVTSLDTAHGDNDKAVVSKNSVIETVQNTAYGAGNETQSNDGTVYYSYPNINYR